MSVESLRKKAKAWLRALRASDPAARARFRTAYPKGPAQPGLRDVQHALAREHGFENWVQLKASVEKPQPETPVPHRGLHAADVYERLAQDLVLAHTPKDEAALARLNAHFRSSYSFEDVWSLVWGRVYAFRERAFRGDGSGITIAEAQMLVAQITGFGSWDRLLEGVAADKSPVPAYEIDPVERSASQRRLVNDNEWDRLMLDLKEQRVTSLETGLMTDDLLARIVDLPDLTALHIGGSRQLTDAGLQLLARMPQLERLNLSNYPGGHLTDKGLEVLRHLSNLRVFEMTWQKGISDAGVANLKHCDKIERVDLMGSPTGNGAIEALQGKPFLRSFSTGRLVTDEGLHLLKNIPQLRTRQAHVDADSSNHDKQTGRLLIDGPFSDKGLANLIPLEGIIDLDLFWHVSKMTTEGFAYLVDMPNLEALGADGNLTDNVSMKYFAAMPRLRRLRAQENAATDEGYEALARSKTLEGFWGRRSEGLRSKGFAAMSKMPALRSLGVSLKHVEDWSLAKLPEFLSLREITPVNMQDDGFRHIGRCERLERLTCMYCRETTDSATAHITKLQIKYYYAGLTLITDRSLELLGTMPSLEEVEFYECGGITDAGVPSLARLPRLRRIDFAGSPGITLEGTKVFPAGVRVKYST
jgi:hypothetical protein